MGDAAAAAHMLQEAVASLYGYDPNAQAQANAWLNQFSASPEAWEAATMLLDPSKPTEVVFFCCNLLLNKVRHSWAQLPAEGRQQLSSVISSRLGSFSTQFNTSSRVVTQRMVLLLSAMAALMGPEAAADFLSQAFQRLEAKPPDQMAIFTALQQLSCLVEEVDGLERSRRQPLMAVLGQQWGRVAGVAEELLLALGANGDASLQMSCLHCLKAWLYLNPSGSSTHPCCTPAQFSQAHPRLFSHLFSLLSCPDPSIIAKSCELLTGILGPGPAGEDPAAETAALEAALAAALQLHGAAMAPDAQAAAAAVAAVVAAAAARDADLATHGSGNAVPVAQMMLQLVTRPERTVADPCCEYFLVLNTVPVADRHPWLQVEVYAQLAQVLLPHLCYPPGFISWEEAEGDEDEDAFHRFREQQGAEVLESVCQMLRDQYLAAIIGMLQSASSWQVCEGALFCAKAVAVALKAQYGLRPGTAPTHAAALAAGTSPEGLRLLTSLCQDVCSTSGRTAQFLEGNPYLMTTAAQLLGDYAVGFGELPGWDLDGALRLLLRGMALGAKCCLQAAHAFRNVCVRAAGRLAGNTALLGELVRVCLEQVAPVAGPGQPPPPVPMGLEERSCVVEGLARLVALLQPAQAAEAGSQIVQPFLQRAQAIITLGSAQGVSDELLGQLASELRMVGSAVRFMEPKDPLPEGVGHPALALVERAWPTLQAVAESDVCRRHNDTVDALCEVYQRTLSSTKVAAKGILRMLITPAIQMFQVNLHPAVLDVVASVAELFGELKSAPVVGEIQAQALSALTAACAAAFQADYSRLSSHGELLRALFSMASRYLIFVRSLLLSSDVLQPLLHWAVAACRLREREPVQAALSFLTQLMRSGKAVAGEDAGQEAGQQGARLDSLLCSEGSQLMLVLLLGLADTCPTGQLRGLAGCLHTLLYGSSCTAAAQAWLPQALGSSAFQGSGAVGLTPELCQQFLVLCQRPEPLTRQRFDALVVDFANVCRGHSTADALLAYQL